MDYFGVDRGFLRANALSRLVKLHVENPPTRLNSRDVDNEQRTFTSLLDIVPLKKTVDGKRPITRLGVKEYETLSAFCDSATAEMKSTEQAHLILERLGGYLLELPLQLISFDLIRKLENESPWAILGEKLTFAISKIATKFDGIFAEEALRIFDEFNSNIFQRRQYNSSHYLALLGYMRGLSEAPVILTLSLRAFKTFIDLDSGVDNIDFLNDIEVEANGAPHTIEDYNEPISSPIELSSVLFIEAISQLLYSITNSIVGKEKELSLLGFILDAASHSIDDDDAVALDVSPEKMELIHRLSDHSLEKTEVLSREDSYLKVSTPQRLKLVHLALHYNLQILGCSTFMNIIDISSAKSCFKWGTEHRDVMLDEDLGLTFIELGSLLVYKDELLGASLSRTYTSLAADPRFVYSEKAGKSVGLASKVLSQDAVVTTVYSLTNLLFVGNDGLELQARSTLRINSSLKRHDSLSFKGNDVSRNSSSNSYRSSINGSLLSNGYCDHDYHAVCENAITGVAEITSACSDETISTLAVTILSQKIAKLDTPIGKLLLKGLSLCAPYLPKKEFLILVKLLNRLSLDALDAGNTLLVQTLTDARTDLSRRLKPANSLYIIYLRELLQEIISKGDVKELDHHRPQDEVNEVASRIKIYIKPLAELLPDIHKGESPFNIKDTETINLFRNIWFNMAVHGFSSSSTIVEPYVKDLERIAYSSPPLASELSWDRTETSLELNTVLRRGSSNHIVKHHRTLVGKIMEVHRTMSYPKLMFLAATMFVESLRVTKGDASTILYYYSDPSIKTTGLEKYIAPVAFKIVKDYLFYINRGANKDFNADRIAEQLTTMLTLSCHRLEELQDTAIQCCDILINKVPSSLCHHKSLFALFDLLTILFDSIIDAEVNEYEPTTSYRARKTGIHVMLSDSYTWRTDTFNRFHDKAKHWVTLILLKSNVDTKSLILAYISDMDRFQSHSKVQFGLSFAIEMSGNILVNDRELSSIPKLQQKDVNTLPQFMSQLNWRSTFVNDLLQQIPLSTTQGSSRLLDTITTRTVKIKDQLELGSYVPPEKITALLTEIAGLVLVSEENSAALVRELVEIPFLSFDSATLENAANIWFSVMKDRHSVSILLLSEIESRWETTIQQKKGLYSSEYDIEHPEFCKMVYSPSDRKLIDVPAKNALSAFEPHLLIIKLFSSNFEASLNISDHLIKMFTRFVEVGLSNLRLASLHPYARGVRFELVRFAFNLLNYHIKIGSRSVKNLTNLILDGSLSWFRLRATYPYGSNVLKTKADFGLLKEIARLTAQLETFKSDSIEGKKILLLFFLDDEIARISIWLTALNPADTRGTYCKGSISGNHVKRAYSIDPILAINLALRYKIKNLDDLLQALIIENPLPAMPYAEAVQYFIGINAGSRMPSYHILFWATLSPVDCISLFLPPFEQDPYILQYSMRSLEEHDVNLVFFYIPQIVQSVRFDKKGNVDKFIVETANVSRLFSHQIIWNMLANSYKDEDATDPDAIKPALDRIQVEMRESINKEGYEFYKREFGFFNEVTDISGKLKPYIKKSKAEKKAKIDEEMAKIKVPRDVYLPSNPEGVVVDISRKSGRPLQSHAKAPFMATFKIKKELDDINEKGQLSTIKVDKWQSAIFKVGDDCRQDVLALQLISVFRTIWITSGVDLYVYPNRVTATAPGCGVIDVLPNSVSRDMLGREAVNGLYEYFTSKFGPENSIEFQTARNNFIKSLAGYSIISYILQMKDRHNGNIMYDDQGHILHIDFGFLFDIVPGGVRFEAAPFKLTHEMVMVLGGSNNTQAFKWFEELCVKGYLACRPHMETIVRCVTPMLESGLPCFKDGSIKRLRQRFVPNKTDKEASHYMRGLIKKSMESMYTKGYDEFQKLTNGIPY